MKVESQDWGETPDGQGVQLYTVVNGRGAAAQITNYGGIVVSLKVPDVDGRLDDVVLGYDTLPEYVDDLSYFGCIVGRYANRIAGGRFTLKGVEHTLTANERWNHLHGGIRGFSKVVWGARAVERGGSAGLGLSYLSRDGEEGYPGNLRADVTYLLTEDDELRIEYEATTDRDTVVNLSHHSYFNLGGGGDVLNHDLTLYADRFTPVDGELIPTGELRSVEGTPMDFTAPTAIGERIEADYEQLKLAGGYDHNWVLNREGSGLSVAARVHHPGTGRTMEVSTTEPGVQFYSGNQLPTQIPGKRGRRYGPHRGLCLEAQHFPDSPNRPEFPSTVLKEGETYRQTTVYRFYTE
ncbi:galactose mutarotase [Candidatus Bathyarchaeota archaeon]|nr:galactose mutarotase [Candidatus Bathyarchaeota archaeon]